VDDAPPLKRSLKGAQVWPTAPAGLDWHGGGGVGLSTPRVKCWPSRYGSPQSRTLQPLT